MMSGLKRFMKDRKAEMYDKIIGISVALVIVSVMIPIGINAILQADNASWGIIHVLFATLLPVIAIVAIVMLFLKSK